VKAETRSNSLSGETLTIDEEKLKDTAAKAVGDAATDAAKGVIKPALDIVESAKESGIGGTWIEDTWKWLSDLFSSVADWISTAVSSLIDGIFSLFNSSPASATETPAPTPDAKAKDSNPAKEEPEQPTPGRTPQGAPKPPQASRGGR
jgi:hypothetical protein